MTLTAHALVGAAAAALVPQNPLAGFALGFASHFVIDAIPHWDYEPRSLRENKADKLKTFIEPGRDFENDVLFVLGDALLGFLLSALVMSLWLFHVPFSTVFWGVFGALVPDGLHFIYFKWHVPWLVPLERFHNWVQEASPLAVPAWVGVGLQVVLVCAVIALLKLA